ncbi:site-specific integrase [Adlercreutzia sp. ZJ242]|uniref:tyrosine-type recombinase/integrase n=1 Tax=Adlercreutzia sp. ZJ242 TaxID=2709409 RepID=UPI00197DB156|nr:site-specific integrase [Adlercreutzia sp. ZJ242]
MANGSRDIVYLGDAYSEFRHQMEAKGYAKATIRAYDSHVPEFICYLDDRNNGHIPYGLSRFPAFDVRKDHLIEWEGVLRLERNNRDTSIKTKIKSIRTFLYWCMDEDRGYCKYFRIPLPKAEERIKEPYSEKEIAAILAQPRTHDLSEWRNWAVINVILRTGLRRSSVCEMKWVDVDFERKRLLIRHSKNKQQYYVPLPQSAIEVLLIWREISPVTEGNFIFFSTYSEGRLSPNSLTQAIRAYNLKRGVKKTSVHLMRHTYATIYLRKGGRAEKLQRILGHKTREMTDRYVHLVAEDLTEGIDDYTI